MFRLGNEVVTPKATYNSSKRIRCICTFVFKYRPLGVLLPFLLRMIKRLIHVIEAILQANGIAPLDKGRKRVAALEDLEEEVAGKESDSLRIKELEVRSSAQSHPFHC
jgi:hypothetical protein